MNCRDHNPALFDACKAAEDAEMTAYLRPVRAEVARLRALNVAPSVADPIGDLTPALEQWRRKAMEDPGADPLARAAAWELTALLCDRSGASDLAASSRANAAFALGVRRAA